MNQHTVIVRTAEDERLLSVEIERTRAWLDGVDPSRVDYRLVDGQKRHLARCERAADSRRRASGTSA